MSDPTAESVPPKTPATPRDVAPYRTKASHAVLVVALVLLGWIALPLWEPVLFAAVLAAVLHRSQARLAQRFGHRNYLAAALLTLAVIILILTPLVFLGTVVVREALQAFAWLGGVLQGGGVPQLLEPLPDRIENWLRGLLNKMPTEVGLQESTTEAGRWAAGQVQTVIAGLSAFAFDLAMMLVAFFFLLADGDRLVEWIRKMSPMGRSRTDEILAEFRLVSRALIGSNFITGGTQAAVATLGYSITGVPQPLFFGLVTLLTSFIPTVGTSIVALPLAGMLLLQGKLWAGLFLGAWALLVVALVDNVLRPYLLRGDMHVHGALIFFVMIGGISLFGVAGLVVGPMVLSLFLTMMRFYSRDVKHATSTAVVTAAEVSPARAESRPAAPGLPSSGRA